MQGGSVRDPLGRASRARGRLNSRRRFEGVLTATQHCHRASLPNLASSSSPMLPARQTTPVVLSVPLALRTLLSAPLARRGTLRREVQRRRRDVQRRRLEQREARRAQAGRGSGGRAHEGQELLVLVERRLEVERLEARTT